MKIILIYPPAKYQTKQTMPPLGIAWLAAVLRQNGFTDVKLIDCVIEKYDNQAVVDILIKEQPDIVGLSFGTQNRFLAIDLAQAIRQALPQIILVAGGPHPTLTYNDLLKSVLAIDIIVRGEGEYIFLNLVQALQQNTDLNQIKGIVWRNQYGEIVINALAPFIQDLDSLPMPARDLLPIERYQQKIPLSSEICTNIITARGCPYNCVYCSAAEQWGHQIRHRSVQNIINEIEYLLKTYNIQGIGIFDDVFTMDRQRVWEFCDVIERRGLNFKWWCEARANTIDQALVNKMAGAGCIHLSMAIESGSNRILKNIRKMITVEQAVMAVKYIKQTTIKLKLFFMYGLPGETYQDIKKTVFLARQLIDKIGVDEVIHGVTTIYPGTQLEKIAQDIGTWPRNFSWNQTFNDQRNYLPIGKCPTIPVFEQPNLSYEQVYQYVRRAKLAYYAQHPILAIKNSWRYRKTVVSWIWSLFKKL